MDDVEPRMRVIAKLADVHVVEFLGTYIGDNTFKSGNFAYRYKNPEDAVIICLQANDDQHTWLSFHNPRRLLAYAAASEPERDRMKRSETIFRTLVQDGGGNTYEHEMKPSDAIFGFTSCDFLNAALPLAAQAVRLFGGYRFLENDDV